MDKNAFAHPPLRRKRWGALKRIQGRRAAAERDLNMVEFRFKSTNRAIVLRYGLRQMPFGHFTIAQPVVRNAARSDSKTKGAAAKEKVQKQRMERKHHER